jgi:hypothetical protein
VEVPLPGGVVPRPASAPPPPSVATGAGDYESLPLIRLAWARSGDKGDLSNVGVIARRAEWMPLLWQQLTPERIKAWLGHLVHGDVERYHLPGIDAINLVMHEALDGGGPASRRLDPLGKGMAQILLDMPIDVPSSIVRNT